MRDFRELDRYLSEHYHEPEAYEASDAIVSHRPGHKKASSHRDSGIISQFCSYEKERDIIIELDESFSNTVLKLIDEKGMKDSDVYNSVNMDRRLFSKLRNDSYSPSKQTAISLCIALKLNLDESNELLKKAGYTLSHSNMSDVIVEYFIKNRIYDIYTIDEALLHYDQKPIGRY
ncbi:MAG: hypothetical protein IIZ80_06485 [Erysipelotrichaceae bacterium]|nr:hypothetical protein [Erysipelotrichaceae bacterium]